MLVSAKHQHESGIGISMYLPFWTSLSPTFLPIPAVLVVTEPWFEFPEQYSKFLLAILFKYDNVCFHVTLAKHPTLVLFHGKVRTWDQETVSQELWENFSKEVGGGVRLYTSLQQRKQASEHQILGVNLRNLAFYIWEDASLWAHGIHSFHMHLSYLGPNPVSFFLISLF